MELMKDCQNCEYREYMARVYDIHIDNYDCWLEKCLLEEGEESDNRRCETCYGNDMEHDEVDNPCWNCKGDHSEWMPKEN